MYNMNARERLFFKDVRLHRSMSLQKRMEKEEVERLRDKYADEYIERMKKRKPEKTLYQKIIEFLVW